LDKRTVSFELRVDAYSPCLGVVLDSRVTFDTTQPVESGLVHAWDWLTAPLTEREKRVLAGRLGLDGEVQTLAQLGSELGLSRERVRQIEGQALGKIEPRVRASEEGIAALHQETTA
jgi:DNA-directed RNA polymerase sigma subunit (sigma70/sigma32)